jgi:hypothetical protein
MAPVQAIYKYHATYLRCEFPDPGFGLESLLSPQPRCLEAECDNRQTCCSPSFPTNCECNHSWLSAYRKDVWLAERQDKWGVEIACHKNNQALSATIGSLYSQFLCLVYRERWWKIAPECPSDVRVYVPGCNQTPTGGDCGGVSFVTSDLVPYMWIYGCSGVPLYDFDLTDAVDHDVISALEAAAIRTAIINRIQPNQGTLNKLYKAGYLQCKDWREVQRQEFQELNDRFGTYGPCIQDLNQMTELGPFRKRLCAPFSSAAVQPWLRRGDVPATATPLQVSGGCFQNYPGSLSNQADYEYWADRQWVYFRGVPAGWTWSCWGYTDVQILDGQGRGSPDCLEAMKGLPRPPANCTAGPPICPGIPYCNECLGQCEDCGISQAQACGPFNPTPVATSCENLVITPECEGVRFTYAQYYMRNNLDPSTCTFDNRVKCMYVAKSYLTEGRRVYDSWLQTLPYDCNVEKPPLPQFTNWPAVAYGHYGPAPICDDIVVPPIPPPQPYTVTDLCCGAYCWNYDYNNPFSYPCFVPEDAHKDCPPTSDCAPHALPAQITCIGYDPDCINVVAFGSPSTLPGLAALAPNLSPATRLVQTGNVTATLLAIRNGAVVGVGNNANNIISAAPAANVVLAKVGNITNGAAILEDGSVLNWGPGAAALNTAIGAASPSVLPAIDVAPIGTTGGVYGLGIIENDNTVRFFGSTFNTSGLAALTDAVSITCRGPQVGCLRSNGVVLTTFTGSLASPSWLTGKTVVKLEATQLGFVVLLSDGRCYGWGSSNTYGEFRGTDSSGNPITGTLPSTWYTTGGDYIKRFGVDLTGVVDLFCGQFHCCALFADGTIHMWGNNAQGQCDPPGGLRPVVEASLGPSITMLRYS